QVLDKTRWQGLAEDIFRVVLLAELHPQDRSFARAACEEMGKRYSWKYGDHTLLRLLGYKDEAVAICRALRQQQQGELGELSMRGLDYLCGDISEEEYLKAGSRLKGYQCWAHYRIALTRLADGDRDGAREHFRQSVQTRFIQEYAGDLSRSFLARMEKD